MKVTLTTDHLIPRHHIAYAQTSMIFTVAKKGHDIEVFQLSS